MISETLAWVQGMTGAYYDYIVMAAIIAISFLIGRIASGIITLVEHRIVKRSSGTLDDMLLEAIKGPVKAGVLLFGIFLALKYLPDIASSSYYVGLAYTVMIPVFVAYTASRLTGAVIEWYSAEVAKKTRTQIDDQFLPILKKAAYGIIFGVMILVMFNQLGVRVETVIAAMGIGGLAVALALQPTLSNFFSGAQMVVDRPLRIGDYIELESGDKGTVVDIGWRSTKIRTFTNNVIVLPNTKIADSKIINYNNPNPSVGFTVECGVAYGTDLEKAESIAKQAAREVMSTCNGVKDFDPIFRYSEFGDSSINFKVVMRTKTLADSFLAKHEFIKKLKKAFDSEGIEIPFPQIDVHAKQDKEPQAKFRRKKPAKRAKRK